MQQKNERGPDMKKSERRFFWEKAGMLSAACVLAAVLSLGTLNVKAADQQDMSAEEYLQSMIDAYMEANPDAFEQAETEAEEEPAELKNGKSETESTQTKKEDQTAKKTSEEESAEEPETSGQDTLQVLAAYYDEEDLYLLTADQLLRITRSGGADGKAEISLLMTVRGKGFIGLSVQEDSIVFETEDSLVSYERMKDGTLVWSGKEKIEEEDGEEAKNVPDEISEEEDTDNTEDAAELNESEEDDEENETVIDTSELEIALLNVNSDDSMGSRPSVPLDIRPEEILVHYMNGLFRIETETESTASMFNSEVGELVSASYYNGYYYVLEYVPEKECEVLIKKTADGEGRQVLKLNTEEYYDQITILNGVLYLNSYDGPEQAYTIDSYGDVSEYTRVSESLTDRLMQKLNGVMARKETDIEEKETGESEEDQAEEPETETGTEESETESDESDESEADSVTFYRPVYYDAGDDRGIYPSSYMLSHFGRLYMLKDDNTLVALDPEAEETESILIEDFEKTIAAVYEDKLVARDEDGCYIYDLTQEMPEPEAVYEGSGDILSVGEDELYIGEWVREESEGMGHTEFHYVISSISYENPEAEELFRLPEYSQDIAGYRVLYNFTVTEDGYYYICEYNGRTGLYFRDAGTPEEEIPVGEALEDLGYEDAGFTVETYYFRAYADMEGTAAEASDTEAEEKTVGENSDEDAETAAEDAEPAEDAEDETDSSSVLIALQIPIFACETTAEEEIQELFDDCSSQFILDSMDLIEGVKQEDIELEQIDPAQFRVLSDTGMSVAIRMMDEVTWSDDDYFSVGVTNYIYPYHAAHGMAYRTHYVMDRRSGERLELEDILRTDPEEFSETAADALETMIRQEPEEFYEDAAETIDDLDLLHRDFYLTNEGIVLQFDQYEIAPRSSGMPTVTIPYEDVELWIVLGHHRDTDAKADGTEENEEDPGEAAEESGSQSAEEAGDAAEETVFRY